MKMAVNISMFHEIFNKMGRGDQFSSKALNKLFEYLEEYEDSTGEQIELDVVALCCDYIESTIKEALDNYGLDSIDQLRDHTQVIEIDDETIIYQNY